MLVKFKVPDTEIKAYRVGQYYISFDRGLLMGNFTNSCECIFNRFEIKISGKDIILKELQKQNCSVLVKDGITTVMTPDNEVWDFTIPQTCL